jgi:hypothetical protein
MALNALKDRFLTWWQAPITARDRSTGVMVGAFAGLWIGALGRMIVAQDAVGIGELGLFALGGAIVFAAIGWRFPKAVTVLLFPFAVSGISPS